MKRSLAAALLTATLSAPALASALGAFSGYDGKGGYGTPGGSPCFGQAASEYRPDSDYSQIVRTLAHDNLVAQAVFDFQTDVRVGCTKP